MNRPWTYEPRLLKEIADNAIPEINYQKFEIITFLGSTDLVKMFIDTIYSPSSYRVAIRKIYGLKVMRGWVNHELTYDRYREAFFQAWDKEAYGALYHYLEPMTPKGFDFENFWKVNAIYV